MYFSIVITGINNYECQMSIFYKNNLIKIYFNISSVLIIDLNILIGKIYLNQNIIINIKLYKRYFVKIHLKLIDITAI